MILKKPRLLLNKYHQQATQYSSDAMMSVIAEATRKRGDEDMETIFSIQELDVVVRRLKTKKALGPDNIPNEFLRNLPLEFRQEIIHVFNQMLESGTFCPSWRESIAIPIPKPNKDPSNPEDYRILCLTSNLGKVVESMFSARLVWKLEKNNHLPPNQFGFRNRRCTSDALATLTSKIHASINAKKISITIFFDMKRAFDTACHTCILHSLAKKGYAGKSLKFLISFLNERRTKVCINGSLSGSQTLENGVPQGAVLSPILFSVLLSDVPDYSDIGEVTM